MKNNTLKKFGAVALAAVMAVTFAPVASLDVFAANSGVTDKKIDTENAVIGEKGDYVLDADVNFTVSDTDGTDEEKNITIDLKGRTSRITLNDEKANVTIKDSTLKYDSTVAGDYSVATLDITDTAYASLKLEGNFIFANAMTTYVKKGEATSGLAVGTTPVAKVDDKVVVGQKGIDVADKIARTGMIVALNGDVKITGLKDGATATLGSATDGNLGGAKITATAASGKSLAEITTDYTYYYTKRGATPDPYGAATYQDHMYVSGAANIATNLNALTAPTAGSNGVNVYPVALANGETVANISVKAIPAYERKITVTKADDWKNTDILTGTSDVDKTDYSDSAKTGSKGFTYFTSDVSALTSTAGVAVIDGSKYVVTKSSTVNQLATDAQNFAASSVKVLKGTEGTATDTNKNGYDTFTAAPGVAVSAPEDESVVSEYVRKVFGTSDNTVKNVTVYGTSKKSNNTTDKPFADPTETTASRKVIVDQVAKDSSVVLGSVGTKVSIDRASGIGYVREDTDATKAGYEQTTFAAPSKLKDDYAKRISGYKVGSVTVPATFTTGGLFFSKEIQMVAADVPTAVDVIGETSAKISATADGKNTWYINMGGSEAVNVSRFFNTKTGERLFTIDPVEIKSLQSAQKKAEGWTLETETFKVQPESSADGKNLYRLFNTVSGEHMYTTDVAEYNRLNVAGSQWRGEGVAFKVADKSTGVPVYGMYKSTEAHQQHWYTRNKAEIKNGWVADGNDGEWGVRFYAFK